MGSANLNSTIGGGHSPSHTFENDDASTDVPSRDMELTELAMPSLTPEHGPETRLENRPSQARISGNQNEGLTEVAISPLTELGEEAGQKYPEDLEDIQRRQSISRQRSQARRRSSLENLQRGQSTEQQRLSHHTHHSNTPSSDLKKSTDRPKLRPQDLPSDKPSHLVSEIFTVSWLIFFSFWGTLARLGVEAITLYPNSVVTSRVLWANLGGSFVLGFLAEDRRIFGEEWGSPDPKASFSQHGKIKKTIPLYIGLATGFCGSFTSFSSFIRDAFLAMTDALPGPSPTEVYHEDDTIASRNSGFSFLALSAILILHPTISIGALKVGAQFALLAQPLIPVLPFRLTRRYLDPLGAILGWGCWIGSILLAILPPGDKDHWRTRATFPLIFSPLGCLTRFYASKYLNARIPKFPLGTFVVNVLGTMVLGMAWDLQHASGIGADPSGAMVSCAVLRGIQEGFCGCLTTVSTWVAELSSLKRGNAWVYGVASVAVSFAFMVIIMGSMGWTIGFASPVCS